MRCLLLLIGSRTTSEKVAAPRKEQQLQHHMSERQFYFCSVSLSEYTFRTFFCISRLLVYKNHYLASYGFYRRRNVLVISFNCYLGFRSCSCYLIKRFVSVPT